jgi:glycosyltransferase involved in cell wall biosynthesis
MTCISIIVLTCDSYTHKFACIEHTLLALVHQKEISKEIIIVDNGSQKSDSEQLERFVDSLDGARIVSGKQSSIARARNIGSEYASGDILLFVDDDTIVLDDLALSKVNEIATQFAYGYGAKRWWTPEGDWFERHKDRLKQDILRRDYTFIEQHLTVPVPSLRFRMNVLGLMKSFIGNFGFIHRNEFQQLDGFPVEFEDYGFEDTALSFLCYHHYGKPAILDSIQLAHVSHPANPDCSEGLKKGKALYVSLLESYGYKRFNIASLLYPTPSQSRAVLE